MCISTIVLLYYGGSLFGVPSKVTLKDGLKLSHIDMRIWKMMGI